MYGTIEKYRERWNTWIIGFTQTFIASGHTYSCCPALSPPFVQSWLEPGPLGTPGGEAAVITLINQTTTLINQTTIGPLLWHARMTHFCCVSACLAYFSEGFPGWAAHKTYIQMKLWTDLMPFPASNHVISLGTASVQSSKQHRKSHICSFIGNARSLENQVTNSRS